MKTKPKNLDQASEFEKATSQRHGERYVLRLYLTGSTRNSLRSVEAVKTLCDQHLKGRYQLDIVDLYLHPERAKAAQIIAAPTLVKEMPLPVRRLIGDLTRTDRVLTALNLKTDSQDDNE